MPSLWAKLDVDQLSPRHQDNVRSILAKLDPLISQLKSTGEAQTLREEDLMQTLTQEEKAFVGEIRSLNPEALGVRTPFLGILPEAPGLVSIRDQRIKRGGQSVVIETQYLPRQVFEQYEAMMTAMKRDLRRRLYVESGYRSPAYQLYLFLFYLAERGFSLRDTARWNALPGYSEHGYPPKQAIDFVNEEGVSGENDPEVFEKLPEYRWLREHAGKFGFVLSYPKGNSWGIGFEPWHWRWEGSLDVILRPKAEESISSMR